MRGGMQNVHLIPHFKRKTNSLRGRLSLSFYNLRKFRPVDQKLFHHIVCCRIPRISHIKSSHKRKKSPQKSFAMSYVQDFLLYIILFDYFFKIGNQK